MRTSEDIYHRVRWDPRFDAARFVLGIDLRGQAPKRMPLSAFRPGGDIPWHRVLFVEADGVVVWDRASGIDRIESAGAGLARGALRLRPPFFAARTARRWDAVEGWVAGSGGSDARGKIRVLTWNTLWDRYDADRIHTKRRRPLLLGELARADADVIALQEVDGELLRMLMAEAWVREGYTVTVDPGGRDVDDAGLLLLSRLPVLEAGWRELGRHKAAAAVVVGGCGGPVMVVNTHLSSDHSKDGAGRRAAELGVLREALAGVGGGAYGPEGDGHGDGDRDGRPDCAVVVVGDFNDGSDGSKGPAARLGLADAWTVVRGAGDRTPTFDPGANPLAAVSSSSGRAARLDRVLVGGDGLRAVGAELRGAVPDGSGLYVSDHYGVQVDFELGGGDVGSGARVHRDGGAAEGWGNQGWEAETLGVPATVRTALAWIPPREVWPAVQAVRERLDPQVDRWPPHVTVLFGFVPEVDFERAVEVVAAAVRGVPAFGMVLDGVRTFERQGGEATVWLDPAGEAGAEWAALWATVRRGFPGCGGRRGEGFTPHLTLGRVRGAEAAKTVGGIRLTALRAEVGELTLLSRRGGEPMRARAVVRLGSGEVRWVDDESGGGDVVGGAPVIGRPESLGAVAEEGSGGSDLDALAERVTAAVGAALPEATVHVVGSRGMGCALPGADLDLVAVLPHVDVEVVRRRIAEALPKAVGLREVVGARVPGLRFRVGTLDVDLILVDVADRLNEAQAVAFSAVTDAAAILGSVGGRREAFAGLARQVKAWARVRGLDSAPFGGVPGIAWSVLVAASVREDEGVGLAQFFGEQAARDWREPIWTPTEPYRDLIAQVGAGFRDLIGDELYRAWELAEAGAEAELFAPPPMHRRHAAWAVVTVRGGSEAALEDVLGRTRGRLKSLISILEEAGMADVHAWPRPFERDAERVRYAIGLGRTPVDGERLRGLSRGWVRGLRGVEVEYWSGGEMPTLGSERFKVSVAEASAVAANVCPVPGVASPA